MKKRQRNKLLDTVLIIGAVSILLVPLSLFLDWLTWGSLEGHSISETKHPLTSNRAVIYAQVGQDSYTSKLFVYDEAKSRAPLLVDTFECELSPCFSVGQLVWSKDGSMLIPLDALKANSFFKKGYDFNQHAKIVGSFDVFLKNGGGQGAIVWTEERELAWLEGHWYRDR